MRMDLRWYGDDGDHTNRIRPLAQELVALQPDVILASEGTTVALRRQTQTIPIVFAGVDDSPFTSLNRPSGNTVASSSCKPRWEGSGLSCSRRSRPGLGGPQSCSAKHARNPLPLDPMGRKARPAAARSLKVELITAPVDSDVDIEMAIIAIGRAGGRPCRHAGVIHVRASRADHIGSGPVQRTGGLLPI
jgi:hypothetical protein